MFSVNWKLKMRKFSSLTASHAKISFFHRFDIDWMLNGERWIEWMAERMNANAWIVSGWVSECVNREINSLIARTGCAQSASSAKSMYTVRQVCVCVPAGVYESVCAWVCRQIIAWTLHKHELQLRKSIANQFVIGPWRGAWSDEFKHFFVSLYNTAQHTIKVDYLWNVYN